MSIFDAPDKPFEFTKAQPKMVASIQHFAQATFGAGSQIIMMDSEGAKFGGRTLTEANAYIKTDGTYKFKDGSGNVLIDSLGTGGNFVNVINSKLNTVSQKILKDFDFGTTDYAGAVKAGDITWNTTTGAITGGSGVVVYRGGIIGANAGVATFTLDAATGNATFAGTLAAPSGTLGAITVGSNAWHVDSSGNMWWGNHASYAAASIKISSAGVVDFTSGTFRGTLNADDITAGTLTGRTIRTAAPAAGVGSSVVVTGGSNQAISLYYDATLTGSIKGYTTEGSEVTYIDIVAASGRSIKLKNSRTEIDGALQVNGQVYPSSDNTHELGDAAKRWSKGHFEDIDVDDLFVGTGCTGCGYKELNLLTISQKDAFYKIQRKQPDPIEVKKIARKKKIEESDAYLGEQKRLKHERKTTNVVGYPIGTVYVWGDSGLEPCTTFASTLVVGVADNRGIPVVLGAEPILVRGKVKKGDFLVTSKAAGRCESWNMTKEKPPLGAVIAIAIESSDADEAMIYGMINKF